MIGEDLIFQVAGASQIGPKSQIKGHVSVFPGICSVGGDMQAVCFW